MRDPKTLSHYITKEFDVSFRTNNVLFIVTRIYGFLMFQFKMEMMESMYKLAKYRYECGNYSQATSYLYFYLLVRTPIDKVILTCREFAWKYFSTFVPLFCRIT